VIFRAKNEVHLGSITYNDILPLFTYHIVQNSDKKLTTWVAKATLELTQYGLPKEELSKLLEKCTYIVYNILNNVIITVTYITALEG